MTAAAALLFLFPPFYEPRAGRSDALENSGHSFFLDPPLYGFVHIPTLLTELAGLLVVGGLAWVCASTIKPRALNPARERIPGAKFDSERAAQIRKRTIDPE